MNKPFPEKKISRIPAIPYPASMFTLIPYPVKIYVGPLLNIDNQYKAIQFNMQQVLEEKSSKGQLRASEQQATPG